MRRFWPFQVPLLIWSAVPLICLLAGPMFCIGPRAQGLQGEITAGIYYGAADLDSYVDLEPDADGLWGLRFGFHLNDDWSVELAAQRGRADSDLGDADLDSLRANLVYNFRPYRPLRPFVTGGLGLELLELRGEDELDLSLNAGGGLRWWAGSRFGLRGDVRVVFVESGVEARAATLQGSKSRHQGRGHGNDHDHGPQIQTVRFDDASQVNLEAALGVFLVF